MGTAMGEQILCVNPRSYRFGGNVGLRVKCGMAKIVHGKRMKPVSELKQHNFLEKDTEKKTGVCRQCGPVRIFNHSGYWQCETVYRANKKRNYVRTLRYGVTEEQVIEMLERQGYRCAICKKPGDEKTLHVDHCHKSNLFRGMLCGNCNRGLGMFFDNTMFILSAWRYLRRFR